MKERDAHLPHTPEGQEREVIFSLPVQYCSSYSTGDRQEYNTSSVKASLSPPPPPNLPTQCGLGGQTVCVWVIFTSPLSHPLPPYLPTKVALKLNKSQPTSLTPQSQPEQERSWTVSTNA